MPPWRRYATRADRDADEPPAGPAGGRRPGRSDPEDVLCEDVALDLGASPEDRVGPRIEVGRHDGDDVLAQASREVLERVQRPPGLAHQGLDPDQVDAELGDLLAQFARPQLDLRRNGPRALARLQAGHDLQLDHLQRREIVLQRCKTRLDVVTPERRQPTRDRLSAHRVEALEITSQPVRELGAAALELQQVLAVGPAPTLLADAIGDRYPHVVEEHLVDLVVATHGADRPDRDP